MFIFTFNESSILGPLAALCKFLCLKTEIPYPELRRSTDLVKKETTNGQWWMGDPCTVYGLSIVQTMAHLISQERPSDVTGEKEDK